MPTFRFPEGAPPETLGAIELTSIARGYRVADAVLKRSPVTLIDARAYSPGKFLVVFCGDVASVDEAVAAGRAAAGSSLFDELFIPNLRREVVTAVNHTAARSTAQPETLGIVETFSALAAITAADRAVKATDVSLISISLLSGLGGKAYTLVGGDLAAVEEALAAAQAAVDPAMLVGVEVVPQLSGEVGAFFPGGGA